MHVEALLQPALFRVIEAEVVTCFTQTSLPVKPPVLEKIMAWVLPSFFSLRKYNPQLIVILAAFYLQNA